MQNMEEYHVPTALTVIAGIFLIIGAICAIIVAADILWRRGWRSMMGIMIPVWIINAAYMGPATLYLYFRYGRPTLPEPGAKTPSCHHKANTEKQDVDPTPVAQNCHDRKASAPSEAAPQVPSHCNAHTTSPPPHKSTESPLSPSSSPFNDIEKQQPSTPPAPASQPHCHTSSTSRPFLATVLVGVSHCGAGCVLGDVIGEWLVYGTSASINHEMLWAALLVDYAFALLFGIIFQYFSIAPMSGKYGVGTVWRAAKADVLSLTGFEVGAFGWMVVYQVGIWGYRLEMTTWTYWWMMQMGMVMGFGTAVPVNWWLLRKGVKEPCC